MLEVLVVDDEPLARSRLRTMLNEFPDVVVVGECDNGTDVASLIVATEPDLVFLDIQMPGLDGFESIATLDQRLCPLVVFVTAYSERAVDAFEVSAVDYLLKPFDSERLGHALERVRDRVSQHPQNEPDLLFNQIQQAAPLQFPRRLAVKSGNKTRLIDVDEIEWIESAGNYVRIHHGGKESLLRESLKRLEEMLDQQKFVRIHRSTIVNVDVVDWIEPGFHGDCIVKLKSGNQLSMSRSYKSVMQNRFGI